MRTPWMPSSLLLVVAAVVCVLLGQSTPCQEQAASSARLGQKIVNVTFHDAAGKAHALHDLKGKKAVVVAFLSFECPVAASYAETLADLAKTYTGRGVSFLGISTGEDNPAEVARQADKMRLGFPVFPDSSSAAADAFQATATPEVFVLDENLVLRYRGRIDDRFATRLQARATVTRQDLRQALDEVLAGKKVSEPVTRALGCPIDRVAARPTGKVTYHREVLPILQQRCQSCHRPGEVAPFSLMTYRQAVRWADDIKEYTRTRKMPPWKPVDGPAFVGDQRLSDKEIATVAAWVDGGTPEGDPKDAPPHRRFAEGWQLGKPDLILTVGDDFELGGSGPDVYRCFVLPTKLGKDCHVSAIEVHPGNRRIVHHAVLFMDQHSRGRQLQEHAQQRQPAATADRGPGYSLPLTFAFLPGFLPSGGLGGWAPGMAPRHLPAGAGYALPKGADVVLQLHYHRSGRAEKDRTTVGLYFAKDARRHLQGLAVPASFVSIPAGVRGYRVEGKMWVRQDCQIHAIMPHMHLLGRQIKVTMTPPGGKTRTLVSITDWDFNWQDMYFFKETIHVKAGTRFDVEGVYDNSDGNPFNPHRPPRSVLVGLQTTNEMCVGILSATAEEPGAIRYDVGVRIPGLGWLMNGGIPGFGL